MGNHEKEIIKLECKDILAIMIAQFEILMPLVLLFCVLFWGSFKILAYFLLR
ncbi:hypothetical protein AN619_28770 [Thermotalea metallivorans]|uniref:Uncharacterized protein n=1 Tax=Thermotalea metallivorans TaxID=520762 RepID=A0A140KZR0_9FIRM|nr:hypothetical protein AN619_28770 [Thermotalea metallivorans]